MITHEEAIKIMQVLESDDAYYDARIEEHKKMYKYITQQETLQAEHEALKKDVSSYLELVDKIVVWTTDDYNEFLKLRLKLSKVGKEE